MSHWNNKNDSLQIQGFVRLETVTVNSEWHSCAHHPPPSTSPLPLTPTCTRPTHPAAATRHCHVSTRMLHIPLTFTAVYYIYRTSAPTRNRTRVAEFIAFCLYIDFWSQRAHHYTNETVTQSGNVYTLICKLTQSAYVGRSKSPETCWTIRWFDH